MLPYNNSGLSAHSLTNSPWHDRVLPILVAALRAVDPYESVIKTLNRQEDTLFIGKKSYNLKLVRRIWLVAIGKAGVPMATATAQILQDKIYRGIILVKEGYRGNYSVKDFPQLQLIEAGHPVPDQRGVVASQKINQLLQSTHPDDLVISLISGGGSALFTFPEEGLGIEDIQQLTSLLLACGASIIEINTLRKHLERLKGGLLAQRAAPAKMISLILSDVVGNHLEVIASGPTVPDPTTFNDALSILQRYDLTHRVPESILGHLQRGLEAKIPETPKTNNPIFSNVENIIVASNETACQAALVKAQEERFHSLLLTTCLQGEASQAGRFLASIAREIGTNNQPLPRPACLLAGGETTVTLVGDGLGGRNTEIALGATNDFAGLKDMLLVTLATDGGDGPTDAAGAILTGNTLNRAKNLGMYPDEYLARNDSYHFFDRLDDLLKPGPTLTNVNDIAFLFAF